MGKRVAVMEAVGVLGRLGSQNCGDVGCRRSGSIFLKWRVAVWSKGGGGDFWGGVRRKDKTRN